jgi:hypothetical protein
MAAMKTATDRGRMREFENQVLARPYAEIEDKLTDAILDACCTDEPRKPMAEGPCAMGVDPGAHVLHYVIGQRLNAEDSEVLSWGAAKTFDDIHDLSKRFNVKTGVMDIGAEKHAVRHFVNGHYGWYGCLYVRGQVGQYKWDHREQLVRVDRTESLDASHRLVTRCRVKFPRRDEVYLDIVRPQMKNLARSKSEDREHGSVTYSWVVTGGQKNDHIRHAFNYFGIALDQAPLAARVSRARGPRRRAGGPPSPMAA